MNLLTVSGLRAGYSGVPVVHGIDITVEAGQIVALLGPNGAGKTTSLMTIAGARKAMGGDVSLFGAPARGPLHKRARRGLALITEERSVIGSLTTEANLRLGRGPVERVTAMFPPLGDRLNQRAALLSGGEQQMLTVGRALAGEPRLLLADELSVGLAPMIVDQLLRTLRAAADEGLGVLLVEQHARKALEIADHAHVMRRGRIMLSGSAQELRGDLDRIQRTYFADNEDEQ